MIKIIKKNQSEQVKDLVPDKDGDLFRYKCLAKMIVEGKELTEQNAMKIYGEVDLRGTVRYLNDCKGYNLKRIKKRVGHGKGSHLIRWWEQIGELSECN